MKKITEIKQERKINRLEHTVERLKAENEELTKQVEELQKQLTEASEDTRRKHIEEYENELKKQVEEAKLLNEKYKKLVALQNELTIAYKKKFKKETDKAIKEFTKAL